MGKAISRGGELTPGLLLSTNLAMSISTRNLSGRTRFSLLWTPSRTSWQMPTNGRTRQPWRLRAIMAHAAGRIEGISNKFKVLQRRDTAI